MSKEDVQDVQKGWETYGWQGGLSLICRLQCTKEPTVIARTVEILNKYDMATNRLEELRRLRGRKIISGVCVCVCVCVCVSLLGNFVCDTVCTYVIYTYQDTVCAHRCICICMLCVSVLINIHSHNLRL